MNQPLKIPTDKNLMIYKIKTGILKIINQVNIFYDQFTKYFRNFL